MMAVVHVYLWECEVQLLCADTGYYYLLLRHYNDDSVLSTTAAFMWIVHSTIQQVRCVAQQSSTSDCETHSR